MVSIPLKKKSLVIVNIFCGTLFPHVAMSSSSVLRWQVYRMVFFSAFVRNDRDLWVYVKGFTISVPRRVEAQNPERSTVGLRVSKASSLLHTWALPLP